MNKEEEMSKIITKKEENAICDLIVLAELYGLIKKMSVEEKKIILKLKRQ
jgi:hypothetical protein